MKFSQHSQSVDKIEPQMAPMIDVVFQLLIFFILTLKIVEPEGDFQINMPIGSPQAQPTDRVAIPDIKVRLHAAENGELQAVELGRRNLGTGPEAFRRLNEGILQIIGHPGNPAFEDVEVEINADYQLDYQYTLSAISACNGRFDPVTRQVVKYVDNIKLAPQERPGQ